MINLRILRIAKGYSQQKLGKIIGVNANTICQWELGIRQPDIDMLIRLSDLFEVSVDFLINKEKINSDNKLYDVIKKLQLVKKDKLNDVYEFIEEIIRKQK